MPEPTSTWAKLQVAYSRASMLIAMVPRAVMGSARTGRRLRREGVPIDVTARLMGESTLDELFITGNAFVRRRPTLDEVQSAAARAVDLEPTLSKLGPYQLHAEPSELDVVRTRRRWYLHNRFDELTYRSAPVLPEQVHEWFGGEQLGTVRVLRHSDPTRPWVIVLHGAGMGRASDMSVFRARRLHRDLGLNVMMPVLPAHGTRRGIGPESPAFDPLANLATMVRSVAEVRALIGWAQTQGATDIAVLGMSLGAPVAALTAAVDKRVDGVAAVVPLLSADRTLAHHLERSGPLGKSIAASLQDDAVRRVSALTDPTPLVPHAGVDRRLIIGAAGDRVTSVRGAQRLHATWGGSVLWHPGGHIGHMLSGPAREAIEQWATRGLVRENSVEG